MGGRALEGRGLVAQGMGGGCWRRWWGRGGGRVVRGVSWSDLEEAQPIFVEGDLDLGNVSINYLILRVRYWEILRRETVHEGHGS